MQLFMSTYCVLSAVQFAMMSVQYFSIGLSMLPDELLDELLELDEPPLPPSPELDAALDELVVSPVFSSPQPTAKAEIAAAKKLTRRIFVLVIARAFHDNVTSVKQHFDAKFVTQR